MPDGTVDAELTTLARDPAKKLHTNQSGFSGGAKVKKQSHVDGWHTDSSYEVNPLPSFRTGFKTFAVSLRIIGFRADFKLPKRIFPQTTRCFT